MPTGFRQFVFASNPSDLDFETSRNILWPLCLRGTQQGSIILSRITVGRKTRNANEIDVEIDPVVIMLPRWGPCGV